MPSPLFFCLFSGSNLQALIDSTREPGSLAHIVVVISNKAAVAGLDKAEKAGSTRVSYFEKHLNRLFKLIICP